MCWVIATSPKRLICGLILRQRQRQWPNNKSQLVFTVVPHFRQIDRTTPSNHRLEPEARACQCTSFTNSSVLLLLRKKSTVALTKQTKLCVEQGEAESEQAKCNN